MSERKEFKGIVAPLPGQADKSLDYNGSTYLHRLCVNEAPPELIRQAVIDLGADINKLNNQGLPPLALAIQFCSAETVACLIDLGAETYLPANNGYFFNAAFTAILVNPRHAGVFETVLKKGGGLHVNKSGVAQNGVDYGLPCLHSAVSERKPELIQPLIDVGAFVDMPAGAYKTTPLMLAAEKGWVPSIRGLLDAGATIDLLHTDTGATALHTAIENKKNEAIQYLIAKGADVNIATVNGTTCLMNAASQNMQTTVELLLKAKADPDAHFLKSHNETALMRAAKGGNIAVARILLEHGADPLLSDTFNRTASAHARNAQNYTDDWNYRRSDSFMTEYLEKIENEALARKFEEAYKRHSKRPPSPGAP